MTVQVYWPSDLLNSTFTSRNPTNAVILGTKVTETTFVVINLLHYTSKIDELQKSGVELSANGKYEIKNVNITVIGTFGKIINKSLLNFQIVNDKIKCQDAMIIVYKPPLPTMLQFYSADPIPISLTDQNLADTEPDEFQKILQNYHPRDIPLQEQKFKQTVHLLNTCWVKRNDYLRAYPNAELSWDRSSLFKRGLLALQDLLGWLFAKYHTIFLKPCTRLMFYLMVNVRHVMLFILKILNFKFLNNWQSLVELSATAQQIDLRLQQFSYFPIQYVKTTKKFRSHDQQPRDLLIEDYPEYIRLYNTLWLIVNDVSMGVIIGAILNDNQEKITDFFQNVVISKLLYSDLNFLSVWLMNSPGGIKLNNELSAFLSDLFRWIIEFWNITLISPLAPYSSLIVSIIAISSTFGATFAIAIFSDVLSIITFHVYCFYFSAARIFNWQLNAILSLFYLFCGQKRNILRNRVDSNDYELDQLFLGTLMFIVLSFLLPTVLAFYVTFTCAELSIFIIIGTLEIITALLNHFPIFVLLLRFKDHKRIPGGVEFTNDDGYLTILNKPISFSQMFSPFNNVLRKLTTAYTSKETITGIIRGHPIHVQRNKLYKLLYSALPSTLISSAELWNELKEEF